MAIMGEKWHWTWMSLLAVVLAPLILAGLILALIGYGLALAVAALLDLA